MASDTTVFIVDDDSSVLRSLGRLVQSAGFCAAVFNSAKEFLSFPRDDVAGCMVLDIRMPDICGFTLQQQLGAGEWKLPIIFLTGHGDIPMSVRAIKSGAVDFLVKPCADGVLLAAIGRAIAIDSEGRRARADRIALQHRFAPLTQREREVCGHVIAGRRNKQIAYDLGTCLQTVKVHRMRIMEKVGVRSVAELARLAESAGIIPRTPEN
jgi:FixJ family two-component response regulator